MVVWWRGCHWWASGRTDVIVTDVNRQLLSVFCHLSVLSVPSWLSRACGKRALCIKDGSSTEDLRAAIDHQASSSNRLKYAVIHTSAVLTENYTQTQEWKTLIPSARCQNTPLLWAYMQVTNEPFRFPLPSCGRSFFCGGGPSSGLLMRTGAAVASS